MTNIKCRGNKEIDLLAINPRTLEKFHVESRITATTGFKIRIHDTQVSKGKSKGMPHRRGLDYFNKEKFNHDAVVSAIREIFGDANYRKILVVWNVEDDLVDEYAEKEYGIKIYGLRGIIQDLLQHQVTRGSRDDILRIMELVSLVRQEERAFLKKLDTLSNRKEK